MEVLTWADGNVTRGIKVGAGLQPVIILGRAGTTQATIDLDYRRAPLLSEGRILHAQLRYYPIKGSRASFCALERPSRPSPDKIVRIFTKCNLAAGAPGTWGVKTGQPEKIGEGLGPLIMGGQPLWVDSLIIMHPGDVIEVCLGTGRVWTLSIQDTTLCSVPQEDRVRIRSRGSRRC